jgi:hypothetical protein
MLKMKQEREKQDSMWNGSPKEAPKEASLEASKYTNEK